MTDVDKLVITAALNGAEVTREQTPHVPILAEEIAAAAAEAAAAGASIVHVHARNVDGTPTQDKRVYRDIIKRITAACDVIVQVSTGGAVGMTAEERGDVITLAPEMATLTTGTVNFGTGVFMNEPSTIERFADMMRLHGVRPEIEVFDVGMIAASERLVRAGKLSAPLHFDLVLGVPGAIPGEIRHLMHMISTLPEGSTWTAAGVGRAQLPVATAALLLGGHVRVGLEDNIYYSKGQLAVSNAQLVARVARLAGELGRDIANAEEARRIVGISGRS